ncbi:tripartite tricarboxylate transporter TctB family protein [Kocuria nitroreducens]|uniref:tripartite tricarboxylate transporter TctB family protein n=1 Tax=Kocuria nitroreducens TaxID=3058914 RepID=UPI0036DA15E6
MSDVGTRPRPATSDVVGNVLLAVVGAVALVVGLGYGAITERGLIGPGFLPAVAGGLVLTFSLVEVAKLFLARPKGHSGSSLMDQVAAVEEEASHATGDGDPGELDTFGRTARQQSAAVWKVFGAIGAAILLIPVLGMLLSMGLLVLTLTLWVERRRVVPVVLTALGAVVFAYVVFVQVLHVPVPTGPLGFI